MAFFRTNAKYYTNTRKAALNYAIPPDVTARDTFYRDIAPKLTQKVEFKTQQFQVGMPVAFTRGTRTDLNQIGKPDAPDRNFNTTFLNFNRGFRAPSSSKFASLKGGDSYSRATQGISKSEVTVHPEIIAKGDDYAYRCNTNSRTAPEDAMMKRTHNTAQPLTFLREID